MHYNASRRYVNGDFVNNNAERMPYKSVTTIDGKRETQLVILDMYKQVDIMHEINLTMKNLKYKEVSKSTFNRIWNTEFKHVSVSQTSMFSKCSLCSAIKFKLGATKLLPSEKSYLMRGECI